MQVMSLAIEEISVPEGRRELKDVGELMQSIKEVGLLQPVVVSPDHKLIAGLHRLEACRRLGMKEINAAILKQDDVRVQIAEIDENLVRTKLTPTEHSELMARRRDLYYRLHPDAKPKKGGPGRGKKKSETVSGARTFTVDTAHKTGQSKRSVEHALQISDRIPANIREKIKGTSLDSTNDMLKIARLSGEEEMREVVTVALDRNLNKIDDAIKLVRSRVARQPSKESKYELIHGEATDVIASCKAGVAKLVIIGTLSQCPAQETLTTMIGEVHRVLSADGSLLVLAHQPLIPDLIAALRPQFHYRSIIACMGLNDQDPPTTHHWLPALWLTKTKGLELEVADLIGSPKAKRGTDRSKSQDLNSTILGLLDMFTKPGDAIIHPWCELMPQIGVMAIFSGRRFTGIGENPESMEQIARKAKVLLASGDAPDLSDQPQPETPASLSTPEPPTGDAAAA